ncbi:MAG: hypothetical protein WCG26_03220 [Chloroflexales bacterium]
MFLTRTTRRCAACGTPLPPSGGPGRRRRFCGARCRRRAARRRQWYAALMAAVDRHETTVDVWLRDCGL